ncbi:MAG: hypothetical protein GY820_35205 [Gammaproteobacteria bacterium]|nr:hypothetical protein [Gammaproteobacteria bacterium]
MEQCRRPSDEDKIRRRRPSDEDKIRRRRPLKTEDLLPPPAVEDRRSAAAGR